MHDLNLSAIRSAASRIAPFAHRTPVFTSQFFNETTGARVYFKCENFQRVGAFKFRGATNAVQSLSATEASRRGHPFLGQSCPSTGCRCPQRGLRATIVMPEGAPPSNVLPSLATVPRSSTVVHLNTTAKPLATRSSSVPGPNSFIPTMITASSLGRGPPHWNYWLKSKRSTSCWHRSVAAGC